jgi:putative ABC transport system permease protein
MARARARAGATTPVAECGGTIAAPARRWCNRDVGLLRLWTGAEVRRRWRAHVAVALLVGVAAAVAFTTAAGARATASAYDRFAARQALPDAEMDSVPDNARAELVRRPEVVSAGSYAALFAAPVHAGMAPGRDFIVFAPADETYGRTIDRPILLRGHLADPARTDEIVINEAATATFDLGVGSRAPIVSLGADELGSLLGGRYDQLTFHGPRPVLRVVGVVRTRLDLGHAGYARNYALATPAFYQRYGSQIGAFTPQLDVRLKPGTSVASFLVRAKDVVSRVDPAAGTQFNGRALADGLRSVRDASHVQALALALVAVAAALAGLLALTQLVVRSVTAMSDDFPALDAIGLSRWGRAGLAAGSVVPAVVTGTGLGVAAAIAGSRLFPTAVARRTGPPPGFSADLTVLVAGAAVIVAVVAGAAGVAAYRWRRGPVLAGGPSAPSRLDAVAATLPPAPGIGFRWALPRGGAAGPQARTAVAGAIVGVCAAVAALTYWSALERLVTTPSAYGWTFDVDAGGGDDPAAVAQLRGTLLQHAAVGDVAVARIFGDSRIGDQTGDVYGFEAVRGRISPAVLEGREPIRADEIMLGSKTARALHAHVGSTVALAISPEVPPAQLHVVGIGVLPTIEGDRFANGAAVTKEALDRMTSDGGYVEVLARVAPGAARAGGLAALRRDGLVSNVAEPPGDVRNLDLVRGYPLWLAGFVALLGLLAVLHSLLASARRRTHQIGILRALGLSRHQVLVAAATQAGTVILIGALIGVPLGTAVGRWTWQVSAHQLGVSGTVSSPLTLVILAVGAALVAMGTVGALAGWWAGRDVPASALRAL